jgi:putative ABC transport system substrate-binding protein
MRRIPATVILVVSVLLATFPAAAQQGAKLPRVGYLGDVPGPFVNAFRQGLRELGYVEGQTVVIEPRWAEGKHDRLLGLATELVQRRVNVMVTAGTQASLAAKQATSTIPIVMAHVGNPVRTGLVASLARPGGNITGASVWGGELAGKQLALLKDAVPRISRVALLWNPDNPGSEIFLRDIQSAARALEVTVHPLDVRGPDDLASASAALGAGRADALLVVQNQFLFSHRTRIVELAARHRLPAMYMYGEWAHVGGLIAYGADLREVYRVVATLVDKILKGAKPADLPVEQVTRLELLINLRTAKALGLTIPPALLLRADQLIE